MQSRFNDKEVVIPSSYNSEGPLRVGNIYAPSATREEVSLAHAKDDVYLKYPQLFREFLGERLDFFLRYMMVPTAQDEPISSQSSIRMREYVYAICEGSTQKLTDFFDEFKLFAPDGKPRLDWLQFFRDHTRKQLGAEYARLDRHYLDRIRAVYEEEQKHSSEPEWADRHGYSSQERLRQAESEN